MRRLRRRFFAVRLVVYTPLASPFESALGAEIDRGIDILLDRQDVDGFWREFELKPGASEAWTTAWVGWCLIGAASRSESRLVRTRQACRQAAAALLKSRGASGWGYNRRSGPDADTTAWVLQFLSAVGLHVNPVAYLAPYIDPGGGVHTFREHDFGSWTHAHDDVAANAGLALLATPAGRDLAVRLRLRLEQRFPAKTFWWSTADYGVSWSLRFLAASGGLSHSVKTRAAAWLSNGSDACQGFELAHRLASVARPGADPTHAIGLVNNLLDMAGPDGWPGGAFLLVPGRDGAPSPPPAPELRGLMTTSLCVRALSEWSNWAAGR